MRKIILLSILMYNTVFAATCPATFEGKPFKRVAILVRQTDTICFYGESPNFSRYYPSDDWIADFKPATGPWNLILNGWECKGSNIECVFERINS